jgi:hypothetical protein
LRAGTMPPVGASRPDRRTVDEVIAAIERELDILAPAAETSQAIATRLATLLERCPRRAADASCKARRAS